MKKSLVSMLLASALVMSSATTVFATEFQVRRDVDISDLNGNMSAEDKEEAAAKDVQFECKNDDLMIRGAIRLPKNFDASRKYPVAILSHGVLGDRDQGALFTGLADALQEEDMISVRFDFDGYGSSDGSLIDNSIKTELNDLRAVMKYVKKLKYIDPDRINLVGFSMGGAVTSLAAGQVSHNVNSMVLWAPASVLVDQCEAGIFFDTVVDVKNIPDTYPVLGGAFTFGKAFFKDAIGLDIYQKAAKYQGPALILHGTADAVVPMSYSERYHEIYSDSELVFIEGGEHVFSGRPLQEVIELTTEFLKEKNR